MYAGMKVNWHEIIRTKINPLDYQSMPLFFGVFTADKGPEYLVDVAKDDFEKLYGKNADFFKHGQPLIQAHRCVDVGGRFFGCRLVAEDAKLANLVIFAEVSEEQSQKKNEDGELLYQQDDGSEGTAITGIPIMVSSAVIKHTVSTVEDAKDFNQVVEEAVGEATDTKFPIIVVCDNGRGISSKKVRIAPDYTTSRYLDFCVYTIADIENTDTVESQKFCVRPNSIYSFGKNLKNMDLIETTTQQFIAKTLTDQIEKFAAKVAEYSGYDVEDLMKHDFLFGNTVKGVPLPGVVLDEDSTIINYQYGMPLLSGDNGDFGDAPFPGETCTAAWEREALKVVTGEMTDEIYDMDMHKIDFVCDANYPTSVKRKIEDLVGWRKDCVYLRDLGTDVWTFDDIANIVSDQKWAKGPFFSDYVSTYEVIDTYTMKQIRVTCLYGMIPLLAHHYYTNIAAPLAGQYNGFVFTDIVEGTLNYTPRNTPSRDVKSMLDELRVNFINRDDGTTYAMQATYTSQDHMGPLSYLNNVVVTQMCIKAIRTYTPRIRFQLVEGEDFSVYKQLIEDNVLSQYKNYFKSLELIYEADMDMIDQKIFNASLECYYRDFAQSEIFDVYAIQGSPGDDNSGYIVSTIDID